MDSIEPGQTGRGGVRARRALSVREFCDAYGLSRSTAHELVRAGKLPDVKIFGKRLIPIDAAEALLRPKEIA